MRVKAWATRTTRSASQRCWQTSRSAGSSSSGRAGSTMRECDIVALPNAVIGLIRSLPLFLYGPLAPRHRHGWRLAMPVAALVHGTVLEIGDVADQLLDGLLIGLPAFFGG